MKIILDNITNFYQKIECEINGVREASHNQFIEEWFNEIRKVTYVLYFSPKQYMLQTHFPYPFLSQQRLGTLPLEIKADRFTYIHLWQNIGKDRKGHPSKRLCKLCNKLWRYVKIKFTL